jgi:hypothetical protein
MSIPDHARVNFQTLLQATADGNPYDAYMPPSPTLQDDPAS